MSDVPLIREAWIHIRGCYKYALYPPPPPARGAIATITAERVKLYWNVFPPRKPIPVGCNFSPWATKSQRTKILHGRYEGFSGTAQAAHWE